MNAYIFQADIYCEDCGKAMQANLTPDEDSGNYPQGPYSDGGGEADCPQHCGACGEFLKNPLTGDGYAYVAGAIGAHTYHDRGNTDVLRQWADRYVSCNTFVDNAVQDWQALRPEDWE